MKTVTEKCWLTADGKTLVKDGDDKAASLFAVPGQTIHEPFLAGVTNSDDFVVDPNAEPVEKPESAKHSHGKGK